MPGRMQRVELGPSAPLVYVDFAHTPQAVAAALEAVGSRHRIVVVGCGGDRDPLKRGRWARRRRDTRMSWWSPTTIHDPKSRPPSARS